jgi:hypothetical protein
MSTGGCSGGQYDTYCTPYSGSAGRAYNCVGCAAPAQGTIQALQQTLQNLVGTYSVQARFGAGRTVVADKVIGLNTARAVGILGRMTIDKGLGPSPVLTAVIAMCEAQIGAFERKAVGSHAVQIAIQSVAKHVPALVAYFSEALKRFGGAVVTPPIPPPADPTQPTVPVIDMGRFSRRQKVLMGGMVLVGLATTLAFATSQKRRRQ